MTDFNTVPSSPAVPISETIAPKQDMPTTKKNYWPLIIILIIVLVGIAALSGVGIGYYLGSSNNEAVSLNETTPTATSTPSTTDSMPLTISPKTTSVVTTTPDAKETFFGIISKMSSNSLTMSKEKLINVSDADYEKYCGSNDEYCDNGFYILDLNEAVTLPISSNVKISVINIPAKDCALNDDLSPISMSLSSFLNNQCDFFGANGQRMEVKATNGLVTDIKQIYFP